MDVTEKVAIAVVIISSMSMLATAMAAFVACKILKLERFREKNRNLLLKHTSEIEHLQKLIASFARVVALDSAAWSVQRNQEIDKAIQEMQFHLSVLEALNTKISADITQWGKAKGPDEKTIPQVIYYEIGQLYPIGHSTNDGIRNFVESKMGRLKEIQGKMFSEMAEE